MNDSAIQMLYLLPIPQCFKYSYYFFIYDIYLLNHTNKTKFLTGFLNMFGKFVGKQHFFDIFIVDYSTRIIRYCANIFPIKELRSFF
jgi:hypothetical protein